MPYATPQDLISRYGVEEMEELGARGFENGMTPDAIQQKALGDASALLDTYLAAGGYSLPLATSLQVLTNAACIVARYFLYDISRPEYVIDDYNSVIKWLEQLAAKKVLLPIPLPGGEDGGPTVTTRGQIAGGLRTMRYTDETLAAYQWTV